MVKIGALAGRAAKVTTLAVALACGLIYPGGVAHAFPFGFISPAPARPSPQSGGGTAPGSPSKSTVQPRHLTRWQRRHSALAPTAPVGGNASGSRNLVAVPPANATSLVSDATSSGMLDVRNFGATGNGS